MPGTFDLYTAYQRLPDPVRATADMLYKLIPERLLFSRRTNAILAEIMKSQWASRRELDDLQFERLKDLCIHAGEHTTYYKRLFAECGFDPHNLQSPEDIRILPLLTRKEILERGAELQSAAFAPGEVYKAATSGSTGAYLQFVQTKEYFDRDVAFTERLKLWMGMRPKWKRATFYRAIMRHPVIAEGRPPFELFRNRLIMSQFHTSDEDLKFYVRLLNDFQPAYLIIFPSTAVALTRYCARTGEARFKPQALMCYSENLRDEHRREAADYWKCKVYNRYGHSEGCISAGDCSEGRMHLAEEYGYTEFLRPDGTPAPPGEEARLIATGFGTHAMPFIRYDTGDLGVLSPASCPCGRTLAVLERVDGRGDDVVYGRNGQKVSALRSIFVKTQGIAHSQIVQEREGEIIVRLVPDKDYNPDVQEVIRANLYHDAGEAFDVRFELVDDVERSASGKVRLVLNKTGIRR